MVIELFDGRELAVPLGSLPRLRGASPEQLRKWRFIGPGVGIRWPELDEDISVENLLAVRPAYQPRGQASSTHRRRAARRA
jgi:hypothetical protein